MSKCFSRTEASGRSSGFPPGPDQFWTRGGTLSSGLIFSSKRKVTKSMPPGTRTLTQGLALALSGRRARRLSPQPRKQHPIQLL